MSATPLPIAPARAAIERFLAFHAELVAVKDLAATLPPEDPETEAEPQAETGTETGPQAMDLFLRLRVAICPQGTPPPAVDGVADIGYVMAALADEALLHQVSWPGRTRWMGLLLEHSLYGSRVAGEDVFDLAEGIADGRINGRPDLAAAILLALSLGFRGRYRGVEDRGAIDALRRRLYEVVYHQPPAREADWHPDLARGLRPVLEATPLQRLPRVVPWVAATVVFALLWLGGAHWIWTTATQPILDMAIGIYTQRPTVGGEAGP